MSRPPRDAKADAIYHVFNRGAGRRALFEREFDYGLFTRLLKETQTRVPMRVLAYCLMPNHWHLVLWPFTNAGMSTFMQRLTTKHARLHNIDRGLGGYGHLYQGRFRSVAVKDEGHLLAVIRYVEANPRAAGLVPRAEDWAWSSVAARTSTSPFPWLDTLPVQRPVGWLELLNRD